MDLPKDTFLDELRFAAACPKLLYSNTSNAIGKISVLDLIGSFSALEKSWFSSVLSEMEKAQPNSTHSPVIPNGQDQALKDSLEAKIANSEKQLKNYNILLKKTTDDFSVFKFGLVGLNKACFASDEAYQQIFGLGRLGSIYPIEEYSIGSAGVSKIQAPMRASSIRKLERKLANSKIYNSQMDEFGGSSQKRNLLKNLARSPSSGSVKYSKTSKSVLSMSDLHTLAGLTFYNLYSIQYQNEKVFVALVVLCALAIVSLAVAEHDYRVTRNNKCSKFCFGVVMAVLFVGTLVCTIIILMSQVIISSVFGKAKENSCIDSALISKMEEDLVIKKLLIPICVGFGVLAFASILGASLSCYLCGQRPKYRLWNPKGGRFM